MPNKIWLIALVVGVVVGAVGLGAWYYMSGLPSTGTLVLQVHDAPCNDCSHVWVTFSSASVHSSGGNASGWTTLNVTTATIDLMALNGSAFAKTIGLAALNAGHYEQVRLTLSTVVVGLANGTNITASMPSSDHADANSAFDISKGATTTLSIDIDLASSLHVMTEGTIVTAVFTPNIGSVDVV